MSLPKHGTAYTKPATTLEVVFRCLGVTLFLVFIFFVVPKLGPGGIQHASRCDSSSLETLGDLQAFLQCSAEEQTHDAEKAKHLLSLAQQLGSSSPSGTGASQVAVPGTWSQTDGASVLAAATTAATAGQQQQQEAPGLLQELQRCQADLAAAKKVIQKHEEVLQQHLQEAAALKAQLQQLQQQQQQQQQQGVQHVPNAVAQTDAAPAAAAVAAALGAAGPVLDCDAAAANALAVAGAGACGVLPGVEWGAEVVIWGVEHKAASAAECCAACLAHGRAIAQGVGSDKGTAALPCNAWVFCGSHDRCGSRHRECWLKHDSQLSTPGSSAAAAAAAAGAPGDSMWTSGLPAAGQPVAAWQAQQLGLPANALALPPARSAGAVMSVGATGAAAGTAPVLVWGTTLGTIRVQLLPELAPGSVGALLRMGALLSGRLGQCSNCRVYRAEPGFLVQGVVEAPGAYVAVPRHPNPPQPQVMKRGMVCWAGGGGGPDWFVNMIEQGGFGDDHLCWGQVDAAGLAVFERILALPVKPKGGADSVEMVLLQQDVRFSFTLGAAAH